MSKLKTHQLQLIRVIVMGVTIATISSHNQAMQITNEVTTTITNEQLYSCSPPLNGSP